MYEENFSKRLIELRMNKRVSARDMSLSIGQNPGYINSIETGKSLPSMANFFYICEYLDITPMDFFDFDRIRPQELNMLAKDMKRLSDSQFQNIRDIVHDLANAHNKRRDFPK